MLGDLNGFANPRLQFLQTHGRLVQDILKQRVCGVDVGLVNGLAVTFAHHGSRSICGDAEERDACVKSLGQRRAMVECSRA